MKAVDFIYHIATGSPRRRWLWTPLGPVLGASLVVALIALALWVDRLLRLPKFPPSEISLICSLPFLIFGVGVMLWSLLHFALAKGTPVPLNPPPKLVTSGPYAYVRNPMYAGAFIALIGVGVLLRSIALVLGFVPLLILLINWLLRVVEEPELEKRLGDDYLQYKNCTPRFFSRIR
ncbi:MAG TPA: isoprenylcysteine carboxylmethyltransferase family protein [bacterium]|jgi:protein-S-isoprenylcysteine O-methyltransferase Ste14